MFWGYIYLTIIYVLTLKNNANTSSFFLLSLSYNFSASIQETNDTDINFCNASTQII